MKFSLRLLYLYLFSFIGLLITIIGAVQLVNLGLKTYVFRVSDYTYYPDVPTKIDGEPSVAISRDEQKKRNDQEQANSRKREVSNSLAMILVGAPVYLYHWKTIKKESKS